MSISRKTVRLCPECSNCYIMPYDPHSRCETCLCAEHAGLALPPQAFCSFCALLPSWELQQRADTFMSRITSIVDTEEANVRLGPSYVREVEDYEGQKFANSIPFISACTRVSLFPLEDLEMASRGPRFCRHLLSRRFINVLLEKYKRVPGRAHRLNHRPNTGSYKGAAGNVCSASLSAGYLTIKRQPQRKQFASVVPERSAAISLHTLHQAIFPPGREATDKAKRGHSSCVKKQFLLKQFASVCTEFSATVSTSIPYAPESSTTRKRKAKPASLRLNNSPGSAVSSESLKLKIASPILSDGLKLSFVFRHTDWLIEYEIFFLIFTRSAYGFTAVFLYWYIGPRMRNALPHWHKDLRESRHERKCFEGLTNMALPLEMLVLTTGINSGLIENFLTHRGADVTTKVMNGLLFGVILFRALSAVGSSGLKLSFVFRHTDWLIEYEIFFLIFTRSAYGFTAVFLYWYIGPRMRNALPHWHKDLRESRHAHLWHSALEVLKFILDCTIHLLLLAFVSENDKEHSGIMCFTAFLYIIKAIMKFNHRSDLPDLPHILVYVFGSAGLSVLNSVALGTEVFLKAGKGQRIVEDLRVIVMLLESLFIACWLGLQMYAFCKYALET
ncbi:hypothetical protein GJAV_G00048630 [Gymnothorax javanicus]|nr:hypothetical protein GJAV_G00048630 [Gymnothorax javanicus]